MIRSFILLLILTACSTGNKVDIPYSSVEIDERAYGDRKVQITDENFNAKNEEKENSLIANKISIIFGPGLYLSSGLLSVIRELEVEGDVFLTVSGHGLSAYFAAMFAYKYKSDYIEWQFYNFLEKVKKEKPFSKSWQKSYREILLKDFIGKRIEDSPITLLLPIYNTETKKVEWIEEGDIYSILSDNIKLQPHLSKRTAAFPWEFFSPFSFRNKGESDFIAILPLSKIPKFKKPDGFLNGIYTKGISNFIKFEDSFKKVYRLPINDFMLDTPSKAISEDKNLISYASQIASEMRDLAEEEEEAANENE